MNTHIICFRGEIRKILCGYPLLSVAMKYESQHEKMYLLTCAPNKYSNQPVQPGSLIRVFVVCMKKLHFLGYLKMYVDSTL